MNLKDVSDGFKKASPFEICLLLNMYRNECDRRVSVSFGLDKMMYLDASNHIGRAIVAIQSVRPVADDT